jgi:hypothetical protein
MTDRQVAAIAARSAGYMFWLALMSLIRAYMPGRWRMCTRDCWRKPHTLEIVSFIMGMSLSFNIFSMAIMIAAA